MSDYGFNCDPEKFMIAENSIKSIKNNNYKEQVLNYPSDYEYSDFAIKYANDINALFLSIDKLSENIIAARNRIATISPDFFPTTIFSLFSNNPFYNSNNLMDDFNKERYINFYKNFFDLNDFVLGNDNVDSLYTNFFNQYADSSTFGLDQSSIRLLMYKFNDGSYYKNDIDSIYLRDSLINKYVTKYNMSYNDAYNFLKSIDTTGVCTYTSFCNEVYANYIGREKDFEKDFGFKMIRTNKYGEKVLNSEEFLADIYLYMNLDSNDGKILTEGNGSIKVNYIKNDRNEDVIDTRQQFFLTETSLFSFNGKRSEKEIEDYLKSHNKNLEYDSRSVFTKDPEKLTKRINSDDNKQYSLVYYDDINKENEIVMYDSNNYAYSIDQWNGGAHAVYITEANNDGIVVSSWGKKYTIEWDDLENNKDHFDIIESKIEGIGK